MIGQQHERLARLGHDEMNAAQRLWIVLTGAFTAEANALIRADTVAVISRTPGRARRHGGRAAQLRIVFRAGHEEGFCLVQAIQAREVQVAAIHDVGGSRLKGRFVKAPHVTHPPGGEVNKARDIAAQIKQGVQLEAREKYWNLTF